MTTLGNGSAGWGNKFAGWQRNGEHPLLPQISYMIMYRNERQLLTDDLGPHTFNVAGQVTSALGSIPPGVPVFTTGAIHEGEGTMPGDSPDKVTYPEMVAQAALNNLPRDILLTPVGIQGPARADQEAGQAMNDCVKSGYAYIWNSTDKHWSGGEEVMFTIPNDADLRSGKGQMNCNEVENFKLRTMTFALVTDACRDVFDALTKTYGKHGYGAIDNVLLRTWLEQHQVVETYQFMLGGNGGLEREQAARAHSYNMIDFATYARKICGTVTIQQPASPGESCDASLSF